jgi:hypothetical protein
MFSTLIGSTTFIIQYSQLPFVMSRKSEIPQKQIAWLIFVKHLIWAESSDFFLKRNY